MGRCWSEGANAQPKWSRSWGPTHGTGTTVSTTELFLKAAGRADRDCPRHTHRSFCEVPHGITNPVAVASQHVHQSITSHSFRLRMCYARYSSLWLRRSSKTEHRKEGAHLELARGEETLRGDQKKHAPPAKSWGHARSRGCSMGSGRVQDNPTQTPEGNCPAGRLGTHVATDTNVTRENRNTAQE